MRQLILIISVFFFLSSTAAASDIKLLYFYEKGCRWCERMDNIMNDMSIKSILLRNADIIRVDVHGGKKIQETGMLEKDLARKYRVMGTPTVIFLNAHGGELLRVPGAVTKEDFKDLLCNYVDGIKNKNKGC
jgi:thioredoxin-related protein